MLSTDPDVPQEPISMVSVGRILSNDDTINDPGQSVIMAVCTDGSRCGSAIYIDSHIQLVADRKDRNDPYKGLDILIQKIAPKFVIVSSVQRRLLDFLEKRFRLKIEDICRKVKRQPPSKLSNSVNHLVPKSFNISQSDSLNLTQQSTSYPSASTQNETDSANTQDIVPETPLYLTELDEFSEVSDFLFTLVIVPNQWFSMSKSMQKLIDTEFVKSKGFTTKEEQLLFITSKVKKSVDVCAVRAISAIEDYIMHMFSIRSGPSLPNNIYGTQPSSYSNTMSQNEQLQHIDSSILMPVINIIYIDPGPVLSIDKFTFESLNILDERSRDYFQGAPSTDQDLTSVPSLFSVLNQCHSPQGKRYLRTMMLWPLQDMDELRHRHDTIEYFINPEHRLVKDQLIAQIKSVTPLSGILTKLSQSNGNPRDLATVYKALWSMVAIIDIIRETPTHSLETLHRITNQDSKELRSIIEAMMNIVDFEASRREKRIQICTGVNEIVDEKKELVKNLTEFCDKVANDETLEYRDVLRKMCRVIYVPRIGFLNSIDYSSSQELARIKANKDFDVVMYTEQSVYFKTKRMNQLDTGAGDIACDLIDVQENVVYNLQEELLKETEKILKLTELCGELDCLLAFAQVSFQRGYTRPQFISSMDIMDIKDVYHPLHCIRHNVVPNDVKFCKERDMQSVKVMIITGPNSCGKTTYMKAACLVIYMAHIGCFVPAAHARIPIVDAILTRLYSANSISTGLSSFATDLHQINYAISKATEKSLIVIDEFGKGTQARDGFHLLKSLVAYFAVRTHNSPFVMIATHFNRLINHLEIYNEFIIYKTFKVTRDMSKDSIVYEFKMMDGVGDMSLADKVAEKAGVPRAIIERASQVREYITGGTAIKPLPPCGA